MGSKRNLGSRVKLTKVTSPNTSLDSLKMRTPCNGDFFTPIIVNRGGHTDAGC